MQQMAQPSVSNQMLVSELAWSPSVWIFKQAESKAAGEQFGKSEGEPELRFFSGPFYPKGKITPTLYHVTLLSWTLVRSKDKGLTENRKRTRFLQELGVSSEFLNSTHTDKILSQLWYLSS